MSQHDYLINNIYKELEKLTGFYQYNYDFYRFSNFELKIYYNKNIVDRSNVLQLSVKRYYYTIEYYTDGTVSILCDRFVNSIERTRLNISTADELFNERLVNEIYSLDLESFAKLRYIKDYILKLIIEEKYV